ncbi:TetR/AcrR family transcriptional regulator [Bifidobacterium samirii]|uniref:AcrR family transcriptional regulator n=1 Tax=Bifidobacterium samirii TaxID=2306974 RepID=A0A430FWM5_9BIFI|nr:TetR/AcrR family transcriptional regulator [Bifidobacterium samirii]RSX58722.1 AcrR family transcriptional regulator [Bifidobacterium samirii]
MTNAGASSSDNPSRDAILDAAVASFGRLGYHGTSIQRIATDVGLTKAGVLHHVGSKEGLLRLVLTEMYDSGTMDIMAETIRDERPSIPTMWRRVVAFNNRRPALVHMFSTLSAEAIDPEHPAHDYFATREHDIVATALNINWNVPDGVDVEKLLRAGFAMMDGIQLRWLRTPGQDLTAMWADCENVLFPLPQWEGYR